MIDQLVNQISPELYERLKTAVETGKWASGERLSEEQRANALQLVMVYQAHHSVGSEHMSIGPDGEIVIKSKQELKNQFRSDTEILRHTPK